MNEHKVVVGTVKQEKVSETINHGENIFVRVTSGAWFLAADIWITANEPQKMAYVGQHLFIGKNIFGELVASDLDRDSDDANWAVQNRPPF